MAESPECFDNNFADLQTRIVRTLQTTRLELVCGYRPQVFELGWPIFYNPNTMARQHALDAISDCSLQEENGVRLPLRGSSLFTLQGARQNGSPYRLVVPAFVQAGKVFIIAAELYQVLDLRDAPYVGDIVPISRIDTLFGPYPESVYAASVSAVVAHIGMQGRRIIEFGSNSCNQLVVAAKYGATHALGIDLPECIDNFPAVLAHDLGLLGATQWADFHIVGEDILEYDLDEVDYLTEHWREKFSGIALPDTAIINIGPSYDILMDGEVMSPHLVALQQAITLGVKTIIVGGLALVYRNGSIPISSQALTLIRQSDQKARDLLRTHFDVVRVFTLPNGVQCLVGER